MGMQNLLSRLKQLGSLGNNLVYGQTDPNDPNASLTPSDEPQ